MRLVSSLIQSILSLPEIRLRRDWLLDYLRSVPIAESSALLEALCRSAERGDPNANEALAVWVSGLVTLSETAWLAALRQLATEENLLSLLRMLHVYSSRSTPPESAPAVPDYGAGRELTVGERRSLARQPNRRAFERLLRDPHPLVLRNLLGNPRLTEDDVIRLVSRRPLRDHIIAELVQRPEWLLRPRVRMTILHNPYATSHVALPLLVLCRRDELSEIFENTALHPVLRSSARELLDRRPPLGHEPTSPVH